MLGLIGGPLIVVSGILVMFDVIERGGTVQGVATIPEFFWDLEFRSLLAGRDWCQGWRLGPA